MMDDGLEARLAEHVDGAGVFGEPRGAQPHLFGRLFSRDVQRRYAGGFQPGGALQQQGRLADAGFPPHEHHGARHDAAAQHEVELGETGPPPRQRPARQGGQADWRTAGRLQGLSDRPSAGPPDRLLYQRIPRPAAVAAPRPLWLLGAALGAAEHRAALTHSRPRAPRGR